MDAATSLPTELVYLAWSVVLLLAHIAIQAGLSTAKLGVYNAGPRDEGREPHGTHAGRAARALRNFLETYPAFVALALGLSVAGKTGAFGAALWFWARVIYLPLYLFGVPYLRTLAWMAAAGGLVLMAIRLLS
jgi:uncharacterized MAPEG superfamily protein